MSSNKFEEETISKWLTVKSLILFFNKAITPILD